MHHSNWLFLKQRKIFGLIKACDLVRGKTLFGILLAFVLTICDTLQIFVSWYDLVVQKGIADYDVFVILLHVDIVLKHFLRVGFVAEQKLLGMDAVDDFTLFL